MALLLLTMIQAACSVSYKFNGASIDYTKTKTITIADFPIRSNYVWGPMQTIRQPYPSVTGKAQWRPEDRR